MIFTRLLNLYLLCLFCLEDYFYSFNVISKTKAPDNNIFNITFGCDTISINCYIAADNSSGRSCNSRPGKSSN